MAAQTKILRTLLAGVILDLLKVIAFELTSNSEVLCHGQPLYMKPCGRYFELQAYMSIRSITVLTDSNVDRILNKTGQTTTGCGGFECQRVMHKSTDLGISYDYRHLYEWIASSCEGRIECLPAGLLPEHWNLIDDTGDSCGAGTQYFVSALVDYRCEVNSNISTVAPPPSTTPRSKPTTPTTTTPFPVFLQIYQPSLEGMEKVILGVAIGLSLTILLVLLIVLYCCERYRHHMKFGKLLRMLGAPQEQNDAFDEMDYGRMEAWKEETANLDALGEYTGVKPDEFLTLDKRTMERQGQIMYDTPVGTMGKGNSCSTLDRIDKKRPKAVAIKLLNEHQGPTDYETEENLELERRMAATLESD
ncbi:uncharacterized protein [Watersipora subatra]|uniref:uncharacterized protein n=1 Tax=Watersipora subatra TaxID=2589382 RepID=UPI00355C42B2